MGSPKRGDWSKERLLRAMTAAEPLGDRAGAPGRSVYRCDRERQGDGSARRRLLWLLRETLATPWEVDLDGAILFFEDVHCPPWHVDGMLTQLRKPASSSGSRAS